MKWIKRLTPRRLQMALVAVPLLLAAAYLLALAANRYVSESVVMVRQSNQSGSGLPGAALLLAGINPPSREDILYLRHYIHSLDLLKRLDARLGLRKHYEREQADVLFRLWPKTSQEWFLDYYRSRVEIGFDDVAGLLTVRVQGFDAAFAQALNQAILAESERFINAYSQRIAREQMQFAEGEMHRAGDRLQEAKARVIKFQSQHKMVDPMAQAAAAGALQTELQAQITKQEAELNQALSYLQDDSHQAVALKARLSALRKQLETESVRGTVTGAQGARLNERAAEFQGLKTAAGFAEDAYRLGLAAVENTRIEATRKLKTLVVVEPPSLPETAVYPRRLYSLVTLLVLSLLAYALARLVVATIQEHQD